jgi:hypothetical protein
MTHPETISHLFIISKSLEKHQVSQVVSIAICNLLAIEYVALPETVCKSFFTSREVVGLPTYYQKQ